MKVLEKSTFFGGEGGGGMNIFWDYSKSKSYRCIIMLRNFQIFPKDYEKIRNKIICQEKEYAKKRVSPSKKQWVSY